MTLDPLAFDLNDVRVRVQRGNQDKQPRLAGGSGDLSRPIAVVPFTIVRDSREQIPYEFSGLTDSAGNPLVVKTVIKGIPTGDYSIEGLESFCCVERKTAADLVGSVCGGHARFEREHERMLAIVEAGGHAAVVCEGNYAAIDDELRADGRDAAANTLLGCLVSWPNKYRCPIYFAGDRRRAEIITFHLLSKWFLWHGKSTSLN